jgi:hypothetical protein
MFGISPPPTLSLSQDVPLPSLTTESPSFQNRAPEDGDAVERVAGASEEDACSGGDP